MKNHTQIRPKKSTTVERKSTSLISMINGQPQGVELGRRLGESGGATTIQKLAVQMLSNQVNHHHHHNHHHNHHHCIAIIINVVINMAACRNVWFRCRGVLFASPALSLCAQRSCYVWLRVAPCSRDCGDTCGR